MPSRPLVFAHRGGSALRPENTIASFEHGMALGADGLELDVHLSRDGIVVVHHDATLERTTGERGRIVDHTADELGRLDAGFAFRDASGTYPFRGCGFGIPRLRDVLGRFPSARVIIELKTSSVDLARRAVDDVRAADAIDRVAFGSFSRRALQVARMSEPRIPTGASQEETRWALYRSWVRWPLGSPRYRQFQVPEQSGATTIVTPRFITYAHRAGLTVYVWTVNETADMRRLLGWGVDGLISDRPDLALAAVRERYPVAPDSRRNGTSGAARPT